jgi:adenylate cyclase
MEEFSALALERGDITGYAYLVLGHIHLMKRDYGEALALSERALEQRPSCQAAWGLKANIMNFCGRPDEAIPLAKQSLRLSPVAQTFFPEVLATAHYLNGSLEEAISTSMEALALAPDSVDARVVLTAALVETGRLGSAEQAAKEIVGVEPRFTLARFAASRPYRDRAVLDRLLDSLGKAGLPRGDQPTSPEFAAPQAPGRRRVAPRPRR